MFCNQCGNQLDDNACFCGKCGAKVTIQKEEIADSVPSDTLQPIVTQPDASQPDTAQALPTYSLTISRLKRRVDNRKTKIVLNGIEQEPLLNGEKQTYHVDDPLVDLTVSSDWYALCRPLHLKLHLDSNAYVEFVVGNYPFRRTPILVLTDFSGVTVIE